MRKIRTIQDVLDWRLCVGCGACAHVARPDAISLTNVSTEGIRPVLKGALSAAEQAECLAVCPAVGVDYSALRQRFGVLPEAWESFGAVLEVWEGHAADPEIRFKGSSGGALTALGLHAVNSGAYAGVLHIGQDPSDATRNSTRLSRTRDELLACAGSRYAAASVCDRLDLVAREDRPSVVIAQPSEVAALRKIETVRPATGAKIGLVLSFFCAGSPSQKGTLELLKRYGVDAGSLEYLRYRGFGWPGFFSTRNRGESETREHLIYFDAWAFLQRFRPYSTHLFPDGSGEAADISCGDPWYRPVEPGEHGSSLIVVRTEAGREFLMQAVAAGHLVVKPATVQQMAKSQENLTSKRGAIWGRLVAFSLLGAPVPRYRGFSLWKNWRRLPLGEKQRSFFGTLRRVISRGYYRRAAPS
jgi:coenzyme F420 hydrogenase subunit beta